MSARPTNTSRQRMVLKLDQNKLDTLKSISAGAYACAVYGASINHDMESMFEVVRHLLGIQNGQSNAKLIDGKSIMGREYAVSAFSVKEDGKVISQKSKAYIFDMLIAPLTVCTHEEFRKSKDLQG